MSTSIQPGIPAGEAFIASMLSFDFAGALAKATPDARFEIVPMGIAGSIATEGLAFFADLSAAFPDLSFTLIHQFTTSDGSTCARVRIEGTQAGDFRGLVNQEKPMDLEGGWPVRKQAGKVISVRLFWCPCVYLGGFAGTGNTCRCTPDAIARYRTRLSGPLLDRLDLQVEVNAVRPEALMAQADGEDSATVALRVAATRQRQMQRQAMPNAALGAAHIDALCTPDAAASRFAQSTARRLDWSSRGLQRALKVARTIADLDNADVIAMAHVAKALQLRRSLSDATS